jgi:hypothetical protein
MYEPVPKQDQKPAEIMSLTQNVCLFESYQNAFKDVYLLQLTEHENKTL